MRKAGLYGVS